MDFLDIDKDMAQRYLNEGFSGGEKNEMRFAINDVRTEIRYFR